MMSFEEELSRIVQSGTDEACAEWMKAIEADYGKIPLSPLTERARQGLGFDPFHRISSGVLLAVVAQEHEEEALARLAKKGIPAASAGRFVEGRGNCPDSVAEELWGLLGRPKEE